MPVKYCKLKFIFVGIQTDDMKSVILSQHQGDSTPVLPLISVTVVEETPLIPTCPKITKLENPGHKLTLPQSTTDQTMGKTSAEVKPDTCVPDTLGIETERAEPEVSRTDETKPVTAKGEISKTEIKGKLQDRTVIEETPLLLTEPEPKSLHTEAQNDNIDKTSDLFTAEDPLVGEKHSEMQNTECTDADYIGEASDGEEDVKKNTDVIWQEKKVETTEASSFDSDPTQSPAVYVDDIEKSKELNSEGDSKVNKGVNEKMTDSVSSAEVESQNTQNSESILKSVKSSQIDDTLKNNVLKANSETTVKPGGNKKKRKCFMLEEEESLDFGSYVEGLETQSKAKVKKINESEKNKDIANAKSMRNDSEVDGNIPIEKEGEAIAKEREVIDSPSLDLIEVTDTSDALQQYENMKSKAHRVVSMDNSLDLSSDGSLNGKMKSEWKEDVNFSSKFTLGSLDTDLEATAAESEVFTVKESVVSEHCESDDMLTGKPDNEDLTEDIEIESIGTDRTCGRDTRNNILERQLSSPRQKVHDLSGLLRSPTESLYKSDSQSVGDIFQIDSKLPFINASPLDSSFKLVPHSQDEIKHNEKKADNVRELVRETTEENTEEVISHKEESNATIGSTNRIETTAELEREIDDSSNSPKQVENVYEHNEELSNKESFAHSNKKTKTLRGFAKRNSPFRGSDSLITPVKDRNSSSPKDSTPVKSPKLNNSQAAVVIEAKLENPNMLTPIRAPSFNSPRTFRTVNDSPVNNSSVSTSVVTPSRSVEMSMRKKYTSNPLKYSPALKKALVKSTPRHLVEETTAEVVELKPSSDSDSTDIGNSQSEKATQDSITESDTVLPDTVENINQRLDTLNDKRMNSAKCDRLLVKTKGDSKEDMEESESEIQNIVNEIVETSDCAKAVDKEINNFSKRKKEKKTIVEDGQSDNSSSSSDFDLNCSADDEDGPKKKALKVISDFNAIKDICEGRGNDSRNNKKRKGNDVHHGSYQDRYSTNLDSSPVGSKKESMVGSQQVILESDLEDDNDVDNDVDDVDNACDNDSDEITSTRTLKSVIRIDSDNESDEDDLEEKNSDNEKEGEGDNDSGSEKESDSGSEKESESEKESDNEKESDSESDDVSKTKTLKRINRIVSDDEDDDVETIVMKKMKGTKRAIESDDSSEDESKYKAGRCS